jgi:LPXTG-site transpeptidase (sortase) family protein
MRARAAVSAMTLVITVGGVLPASPASARTAVVSTSGVVASDIATPRSTPAAGRRVVIPAIGVDAGIIPVGTTPSGGLAVGTSVRSVYRWRYGVVAGQPGSAVLAGHTWSRGPGVFDRLGSLRRGYLVRVGPVRFRVTRVRRVTKLSRAEVRGLYSDRGEPRLVLITCGNRNNTTGVYRTRIIVNAKKV